MNSLDYIPEPTIRFGNNQEAIDPRDGLALFGPNETSLSMKSRLGLLEPQLG